MGKNKSEAHQPGCFEKKAGVDWTHFMKNSRQYHKAGTALEFTGEKESGEAKTDLKKVSRERNQENWTNMGPNKENYSKPNPLEGCDCCPVLHLGV